MTSHMNNFVWHLMDLVQQEVFAENAETKKLLKGSPSDLQVRGVAIINLNITDVQLGTAGSSNIVLEVKDEDEKKTPMPQHRFTIGDFVALKYYGSTPEKEALFWFGIIVNINKWRIVLYFSDNDKKEESIKFHTSLIDRCQIVLLPSNVSHERITKNLAALNLDLLQKRKNIPALFKVLFGMRQPSEPKEIKKLKVFDTSLNEYQQEAVRFVLGSPEISLIHGPPGKTHTLIEVIRQLVADNKRVLVCGPSNVSVDNLMIRYLEHDNNAIRIGHPARVSQEVIDRTLEVLCSGKNTRKDPSQVRSSKKEKAELIKRLSSVANKRIPTKEIKKQINKPGVIFSTLNGSGSAKMRHEKFDVVIIDEAAQATEPDCWIAIKKANKVILAGDHWQLPPTVKTFTEEKKKSNKKLVGLTCDNDLTYTLYDRMRAMYGNSIRRRLTIQYRMHQKIMEFSSQEFYGRNLIAHESVADHTLNQLPKTKDTANTKVPLILIDTSDKSKASEVRGKRSNDRSIVNPYEVEIIKNYIAKLIKDGIKPKQIAVITPYRSQAAKIVSELRDNWVNIEVGTVDGFQGKEKEVILLSLVRSNRKYDVGFVADRKRLNVAMTRAKRQLVVVGDTGTLGKNVLPDPKNPYAIDRTFLSDWIKWLKKNAEFINVSDKNIRLRLKRYNCWERLTANVYKLFVQHLVELVNQEKKASLDSERKLLLGDPRDLEKKGIAILNLRELGSANMPNHKIVAGDMVQIRSYDSRFDLSDESTTGIVSSISKTGVRIVLINEIPTRGSSNIVKFPSQETFRSLCAPRHSDLKEVDFIGQDLDTSQMEAVKFSVGPDKISLIHGPPEYLLEQTGKTHTLIEIIRQLVENQKLRLLVCAPSNTAVDKYEHINTLRIGNIARISPDLHKYLQPGSEMDELTEFLDGLSIKQLEERFIEKTLARQGKKLELLLVEADVVFCTLNGYLAIHINWVYLSSKFFTVFYLPRSGNALMEDKQFDVVIIDEAGQATEPDCWIALLKSKKVILCGDHLQLPPTILSQVKNVLDPRPEGISVLNDLSYTLFDRLMDMHGEKIKKTLTMQYRMHEEIMKFSSQELYENKLVAHESMASHLLMDLPNVNSHESTNSSLILIDTGDSSVERSSANDMEVVLVEKHIDILMRQGGLEQEQLGVITPYAAQVFNLRNVINKRWKHIEVNSIDGYQGREKECIIISIVRSNKEGNVGFLSDKRRLNVAMTRARRQLVVIDDTRTLLSTGPRATVSSALKRKFLTKWIGWLEDKSIKKLSKSYLNSQHDIGPLR
ncbi:hypothetical protein MFLAVUS_008190 [Mucor flavus]|uniref:DNA helicase n=1 Tax=Mucor flavus TaxID=439312 RepID=A0ABP9Z6D6_9FUNG